MRTDCLPSSSVPHLSKLYLDILSGSSPADSFYAARPAGSKANGGAAGYSAQTRSAVADVLDRQNRGWKADHDTLTNISRLRNGASAVVTGQQVTLFGGQMFAVLKALTAIHEADKATRTGIDCVPIFWLASEDHDLAEVSSVTMLAEGGNLRKFTAASNATEGAPVGGVKFGDDMQGLVEEAARLCSDADVAAMLRESYLPGSDFVTAFARLFTRLFSGYGLILLDPADAELHRIAKPLLVSAAEHAGDLNRALLERGKALETAGYHAQVKVTPSSTLLFALENGSRLPVHRANGHFTIGKKKVEAGQLVERVSAHPEEFSANALLRPVMQDQLLPTLTYVGGPAEVAYFAQSDVVYRRLLGRTTPILPRMSATVVETKVGRLLDKYGLRLEDTFCSTEELQRKIAAKCLPSELILEFSAAEKDTQAQLKHLAEQLKKLDPTLEDAAKRAASKILYQISRLKTRAGNAEARRSSDVARHASQISNSCFPHKDLQERGVAGISLLGRNGLGLLKQLLEAAGNDCHGHHIIYL